MASQLDGASMTTVPVLKVVADTQAPHNRSDVEERPAMYQALLRSGVMKTCRRGWSWMYSATRESVG